MRARSVLTTYLLVAEVVPSTTMPRRSPPPLTTNTGLYEMFITNCRNPPSRFYLPFTSCTTMTPLYHAASESPVSIASPLPITQDRTPLVLKAVGLASGAVFTAEADFQKACH